MITAKKILENLRKLIGQEFDYDAIVCDFEDFEEGGESDVYVGKSHNNGYDYMAYINIEESTQFLISVKRVCNEETQSLEKEIIEDVWMV